MTTVIFRGERREIASFTPEEYQEFLQWKIHNIARAQQTIAALDARLAELERLEAMSPMRRWFSQKFNM